MSRLAFESQARRAAALQPRAKPQSHLFKDSGPGRVLNAVAMMLMLLMIAGGVVRCSQRRTGSYRDVVGAVDSSGYLRGTRGAILTRIRLADGEVVTASNGGPMPLTSGTKVTLRAYDRTFGQPRYIVLSVQN